MIITGHATSPYRTLLLTFAAASALLVPAILPSTDRGPARQAVGYSAGEPILLANGVFNSASSDLSSELEQIAMVAKLKPGIALCEMGSANGLFLAGLGKYVMPGGTLLATSPLTAEREATLNATRAEGFATSVFDANDDVWAVGMPPACAE